MIILGVALMLIGIILVAYIRTKVGIRGENDILLAFSAGWLVIGGMVVTILTIINSKPSIKSLKDNTLEVKIITTIENEVETSRDTLYIFTPK